MSDPRGRHIILTLGRSGSNTLVDMLNQNPAVLNYGEVLGDWTKLRRLQRRLGLYRGDDHAYLRAVLGGPVMLRAANGFRNLARILRGRFGQAKRLRGIRTVGFKEFALNLAEFGVTDILHETPAPKIIGLTRANILARMVSNEILQATGVVLVRGEGGDAPGRLLQLSPEQVIARLQKIEAENLALEEMLNRIDGDRVIRLDYEDLYGDSARTIAAVRRVFAFLDVPDFRPEIRMAKILQRDPVEAFENPDEIRAAIAGTRFVKWLGR